MSDAPGMLYIVSTPIGNLGDLSARAIETLKQVHVVLAEDTRHSRPLLHALRHRDAARVVSRAQRGAHGDGARRAHAAGESMALISDAGTPLLSDPGARLVDGGDRGGHSRGADPRRVGAPLRPGRERDFGRADSPSSAFSSGRARERTSAIEEIASLSHTAVLYEAAPRVAADAARSDARPAAVSGWDRWPASSRSNSRRCGGERSSELAAYYDESPPRGEVVIVIAGAAGRGAG